MPRRFEPKTAILPQAQKEIWPQLAPAPELSFVLYGGTAVALHLGHRVSMDFDFFCSRPLDKSRIKTAFAFMGASQTVMEDPNSMVVLAAMKSGPVKVSYFGKMDFGHVNEPLQTSDAVLRVASLDDLMATKLKAILDRAEVKDYRDIAALIGSGVSLDRGLAAFSKMFVSDPALPLKALGYFKDGNLSHVPATDQVLLCAARDRVTAIPSVDLKPGLFDR